MHKDPSAGGQVKKCINDAARRATPPTPLFASGRITPYKKTAENQSFGLDGKPVPIDVARIGSILTVSFPALFAFTQHLTNPCLQ